MTALATRPARATPLADPHVPALELLDSERLENVLTEVLAGAADVTNAEVEYLEYSPRAALVLQASADVNGVRRSAVVRAGRAACRVARETGKSVRGMQAVVHWLPFDPHLQLLAVAPPAVADLLSSSECASLPVSDEVSLKVLSYVPGRRATFALEPYVVKTYGSKPTFKAARAAQHLLGDGVDLPTPRAVGALPTYRMTVQRHVTGTPADRSDAVAHAGTARHLIDRLHASSRAALVRRDPQAQLRGAESAIDTLAAVLPSEAPRARRVFKRLVETAPVGLPLVLSHGDFTIDQLLVDPAGYLTVTDVDNACQAPAALDVASFAANVMSGRTGDVENADAVLDELLAWGAPPPAVEWHYAVALLRRCDRPFRRLKKRWPDKATAVLDHAETVCASLR
jgi:hypothetical protein